mmetsp:Transcript_22609/g.49357  ORF Transcript_22609/g.49357 Transcript_22609/m.49357 type:complete len:209 (+) Transcript_22609:577-1203(+)
MVHNVIGPHLFDPFDRFGTRRRGNDREFCQLFDELNQDGTHTSGSSQHEDAVSLTFTFLDGERVKQQLPSGNGSQRESSCFRKVHGIWLFTSNALVNALQFCIGAGFGEFTGVKDLVADGKVLDLVADLFHNPGRIPTQHTANSAVFCIKPFANLVVDRIHRDTLDTDHQIPRTGSGRGNVEFQQLGGIAFFNVAKCLHDGIVADGCC